MAVLIETSVGDLVLDLYTKERPKTCLNFLKLCKIKFYNYCLFYSVQTNFIAQTGDPTGTGEGGKSVWGVIGGEELRYVECELVPRLKHTKIGTVSMISNDSNCHTSQFFLTLRENLDYLDGKHSVFGEVAEGLDVLQKLNEVVVDKNGRPLQDVRIFHTVILEDPFDDPRGLVVPERSPSPPADLADVNHLGVDEAIEEFEGKTAAEIQEAIAQRESKANAHILEMVGDIPDADAKPPENVLFVCKLNPATSSEDLEIIFSRFGSILSCEVIRDQKTGDSLQYAFIEFENEDDCIKAYFKMDNVLIDDRRIHVDFSQSLAKTKHTKFTPSSAAAATRGSGNYEMVFDDSDLVSSDSKSSSREHSKGRRHDDKKRREDVPHRSRNRSRSRSPRSKGSSSRHHKKSRSKDYSRHKH